MQKKKIKYKFCAALFLCALQIAGINLYAQQQVNIGTTAADSTARRTIVVPARRSDSSTSSRAIVVPANRSNSSVQETTRTTEADSTSSPPYRTIVVPAKRSTSLTQESVQKEDTADVIAHKTIVVPAKRSASSEQETMEVSEESPVEITPRTIIVPTNPTEQTAQETTIAPADSTVLLTEENILVPVDTTVIDSLEIINQENMQYLTGRDVVEVTMDTIPADTPLPENIKKVWYPNPTRATWLAIVFPGGGQIYNRKYWKLPIVYGGFVGCAYALTWNNNMFKDYSKAYLDIMDGDPSTNSYYDLIRGEVVIDETVQNDSGVSYYSGLLKRRKDYYRRYRDISVFAFIGVYLLSIIDAYVDAELSNFDIGPDISMRVEPAVINNGSNNLMNRAKIGGFKNGALGLQCSIRF